MEQTDTPSLPQHADFTFDTIFFTSNFDSGNCARVEETGPNAYSLWNGNDAMDTKFANHCRSWFHFRCRSSVATEVSITIKNMNRQDKLYKEGLLPLVKKNPESNWTPISNNF